MALFQILHGDDSRLDTKPFKEGNCYLTHSGFFYADINLGTVESPDNQRIKIKSDAADGLSAYDIATQQGFSGTIEEFGTGLANAVKAQMLFGNFDSQITWNENETVYTQTWVYNGDSYQQIITEVSDTQFVEQIYINNIIAGTWTTTIDENGRIVTTTYSVSE